VELDPGQITNVIIELTTKDFSFWNPETKDWFFEKGTFIIKVGSSSKEIKIQEKLNL